jgi:hypothetical protein
MKIQIEKRSLRRRNRLCSTSGSIRPKHQQSESGTRRPKRSRRRCPQWYTACLFGCLPTSGGGVEPVETASKTKATHSEASNALALLRQREPFRDIAPPETITEHRRSQRCRPAAQALGCLCPASNPFPFHSILTHDHRSIGRGVARCVPKFARGWPMSA